MLYAKKIKANNTNDSLSLIFDFVNPKSTVLDIGCATGSLAKQLYEQKNCVVYGMEQNKKSVAICKKRKIFEEIHLFDINLLDESSFPQYRSKFDYIVCADVLEHLLFPSNILSLLQNFLKPSGKIIISLPNVAHASIKSNLLLNDFTYTEIGILDKTHLHFYTYKSIAQLLSSQNLKITYAKAVTLPLDGWQPNKLNKLPSEISKFISEDKHSHIMQYVVVCDKAECSFFHNISQLENILVEPPVNNIICKLKRFLVNKFPKLLNFIENFRL